MPKPLEDFDLGGLSNGYDPVAAVEGDNNSELPEDDGELNVAPREQDEPEDDEGTGGGLETETDEDDPPAEDEETEEETDPPVEKNSPAEDETDPPAEEDELVPGVPNDVLKEKTRERVVSLVSTNKELRTKLEKLQSQLGSRGEGGKPAQQQETPAAEFDRDAIKTMFDKAVDGDFDAATETMMSIISQVASTAEQRAIERSTTEMTHAQQQRELDKAVVELTSTYSVLDPDSSDFDREIATEVRDMRDLYISRGMDYASALRKAAEKELRSRAMWEVDTDQLNSPPPKTVDTQELVKARNKKALAKKGAADQPPAPASKKGGQDQPRKSILDYTDEEFDKLSDSELERLTGTQYS